MKLPVSDKTASYVKPHIKKGYYPAVLLSVEPYNDSQTKLRKQGKFGTQLIFEFAIFKKGEQDQPIELMTYASNPDVPGELSPVIIAKFVYDQYKNKQSGELQTAVTPNSAITGLLKSLGWTFSLESPDTDLFIGKWVEVNIDDYEYEEDGEKKVASTIKDVGEYKGPEVKGLKIPERKQSQKVEKQVKHESVQAPEEKKNSGTEDGPEVKELQDRIKQLEKMNQDGFLTNEGLAKGKEQIEAQIAAARKG